MKKEVGSWHDNLSTARISKRTGPVAPSLFEQNFYKKFVKKAKGSKKTPRMLVLGATPELRNLGMALGFEVVAVDIDWQMFGLMEKFIKVKNRSHENIIKADWLKVPLPDNYFDVIVGDASLNNIFYRTVPAMLKRIHGWLKPSGLFVIRHLVLPQAVNNFNEFKKTIEAWRKGQMCFREFYFRFRFLHSYPQFYSQKNKAFYAAREYRWIDQLHKRGFFNDKEYKIINCLRGQNVQMVFRMEDFKKEFNKFFKPVDQGQEFSSRFGFYPLNMFCWKVKK